MRLPFSGEAKEFHYVRAFDEIVLLLIVIPMRLGALRFSFGRAVAFARRKQSIVVLGGDIAVERTHAPALLNGFACIPFARRRIFHSQ